MSQRISKARVRGSNGTFPKEEYPIATTSAYIDHKGTPLLNILEELAQKIYLLDQAIGTKKGLDGIDGRNVYVVFSKYSNGINEQGELDIYPNYIPELGNSYYMGVSLITGIIDPRLIPMTDFSWIPMGGAKGDRGPEGKAGPQGEKGEDGDSLKIRGIIDGSLVENIEDIITTQDDINSLFLYTTATETAFYFYGYERKGDETSKLIWKNLGLVTGKSAYDLAKELGYSGSLEDWLESLKGASAYEIAKNNYIGEWPYQNEEEWLESLTAYSDAVETGAFEPQAGGRLANREAWIKSLKGDSITDLVIDEKDNKFIYSYKIKQFDKKGNEILSDTIEKELEFNNHKALYLENDNSIKDTTYSLRQRVEINTDENTAENPEANHAYGTHSVVLGRNNSIGEDIAVYDKYIIKDDNTKEAATDAIKLYPDCCFVAGYGNKFLNAQVVKDDTNKSIQASAAIGYGLLVSGTDQFVIGKYNKEDAAAVFIIGGGTGEEDKRKNIFSIDREGNVQIDKTLTVDSIQKLVVNTTAEIKGDTISKNLKITNDTELNNLIVKSIQHNNIKTSSSGVETKTILPISNSTYNLGNRNKKWKYVYADHLNVTSSIEVPSLIINGPVKATDFNYSDGSRLFTNLKNNSNNFLTENSEWNSGAMGYRETFNFGCFKIILATIPEVKNDNSTGIYLSAEEYGRVLNAQATPFSGDSKPSLGGNNNLPDLSIYFEKQSDGGYQLWVCNDNKPARAFVMIILRR